MAKNKYLISQLSLSAPGPMRGLTCKGCSGSRPSPYPKASSTSCYNLDVRGNKQKCNCSYANPNNRTFQNGIILFHNIFQFQTCHISWRASEVVSSSMIHLFFHSLLDLFPHGGQATRKPGKFGNMKSIRKRNG